MLVLERTVVLKNPMQQKGGCRVGSDVIRLGVFRLGLLTSPPIRLLNGPNLDIDHLQSELQLGPYSLLLLSVVFLSFLLGLDACRHQILREASLWLHPL